MERVVKYTITRLSLLDDMTYKAIDLLICFLGSTGPICLKLGAHCLVKTEGKHKLQVCIVQNVGIKIICDLKLNKKL